MTHAPTKNTDKESPWKELLEEECPRVLAFFWPKIHADIDWTRDWDSLAQELRSLEPQTAGRGKRVADNLIKVHSKDKQQEQKKKKRKKKNNNGDTGEVRFLHVEIQGQRRKNFAWRMHDYNLRAEYRYGQPVVSLVILIDEDETWCPKCYQAKVYGTRRLLTFRTRKILDWRGQEDALLADPNPVGLFVLAHLEGQRHKDDEAGRSDRKWELVMRLLAQHSGTLLDMRRWLAFFDWLLPLSPEYNRKFWQRFAQHQQEQADKENPAMPLASYLEQVGIDKGLEKGLREGLEKGRREGLVKAIALGLDLKYGAGGNELMPQVEKIQELATLQAIYDAIRPVASLDDIRKLIPSEAMTK